MYNVQMDGISMMMDKNVRVQMDGISARRV